MDWQTYRSGTSARLLVPLKKYVFTLEFVEYRFSKDEVTQIQQAVTAAVVSAIRAHQPKLSLSALRYLPAEDDNVIFGVGFGHPVYDFQIQFGTKSLLIGKVDTSVEDLFEGMPLIESVANQLFSSQSKYSLRAFEFFNSIYRADHTYGVNVQLGSRITDESVQPRNTDVVANLMRMGPGTVLGDLQPELVKRTNITTAMTKTMGGRESTQWFTVEAPVNVLQRDLSFQGSLRRGEDGSSDLTPEDFGEFSSVLCDFYRDIFLERFIKPLTHDINLSPKLS